jgi:hypothetical protein
MGNTSRQGQVLCPFAGRLLSGFRWIGREEGQKTVWDTVFPTNTHEPHQPPDALLVHNMAVFRISRPHWGHGPSDFCGCQVICRTP